MASETTIISMREDFMMLTELLLPIGKFACDWQTLIAGSFALLGAYFTIKKMREQIALQKQQMDWEKERAQKASRLRLSHALSELCQYYSGCIQVWRERDAASRPELPLKSIDAVIDAGANADQSTFGIFNEIASSLQSFNACITGQDVDYPAMLIDLVYLQYYTDELFDYARFKADEAVFDEAGLDSIYGILSLWRISRRDLDDDTVADIKIIFPEFEPPIDVEDIN